MKLAGGCLCGAVRYQTEGKVSHETICHCTLCRRASGAPFVAWFTVSAADFRFTQAVPASFASSATGMRSFCASCGTQLVFRSSDLPDELDVTIASLDDAEAVVPRDHTWTSSKLGWVELDRDLEAFAGARR